MESPLNGNDLGWIQTSDLEVKVLKPITNLLRHLMMHRTTSGIADFKMPKTRQR